MEEMTARSVSGILHQGGTILKSARSEAFMTPEGRKLAYNNLYRRGIKGLIPIGGNGSLAGALALHREQGIPVVGIPGTIDNDLDGTDFTIGYDTATNMAVTAIDAIRNTASSHNRLFFVEVMGRDSGFIALRSAIASGAEAFLIPEAEMDIEELITVLEEGLHNNKSSSLVVVAEAGQSGRSFDIAREVQEKFPYYDTKVTILGHLLRGGSPTTFDRLLASRLGVAAVEGLIQGEKDVMAGRIEKQMRYTPIEKTIAEAKSVDEELVRVAHILSI
jgi:6-phosphofructokinase 1